MILLLGGTSETAPIAIALAEAGHAVLVSTATDIPLYTGAHPAVRRRSGRLDAQGLAALAQSEGVTVIVDATHPYAVEVHNTARLVAARLQRPYVAYRRASGLGGHEDLIHAANHEQAAPLAFALGRAVLLTTGSRHLAPYVRAARLAGHPLLARVLDAPESLAACRRAGLDDHAVVAGRGPFSIAQNRALIRRFGIGVLVTKDSGAPGGLAAKLEAAAQEGCQVVVVDRPKLDPDSASASFVDVVRAVQTAVPPPAPRPRLECFRPAAASAISESARPVPGSGLVPGCRGAVQPSAQRPAP